MDEKLGTLIETHIDALEDYCFDQGPLWDVLDDELPDAFGDWVADHEPIELIEILLNYYKGKMK